MGKGLCCFIEKSTLSLCLCLLCFANLATRPMTTMSEIFNLLHFCSTAHKGGAWSNTFVQSNCHILQFLHQMFNVSALLLDDALLKCVVTKVVLFSVVAFKTLDISQGSVATGNTIKVWWNLE